MRAAPPPFAAIFEEKAARLSCHVTDLPGTAGLAVTWRKAGGEQLETKVAPAQRQPDGRYRVVGVASACLEDWLAGEVFVCQVSHPELIFPLEDRLQRKEGEPWGGN